MATHELLGGKVQIYKRDDGRYWQCSASVGGMQRRTSTKKESLSEANDFAEDWYLTLVGKKRAGLLKSEKTFRHPQRATPLLHRTGSIYHPQARRSEE